MTEQHLLTNATPSSGLFFAPSLKASSKPLARKFAMQSGMAPCPGKMMRSAARTTSGSCVMRTSASGAAVFIACATLRRLPMP